MNTHKYKHKLNKKKYITINNCRKLNEPIYIHQIMIQLITLIK